MLLDDFSGPNKKNINKKYVVYLEGKPAIYYANLREAEGDIDDIKKLLPTLNLEIRQEVYIQEDINNLTPYINESLDENLKKWFKEKWVRFGPDGKIRGDCARGDSSEGKPKCLPQAKAHALGKKGRKYAASKKRREDPNPERSGSAINVATKKKTNEDQTSGIVYATGPRTMGTNDVDLIFKNLNTNKIVAWVVGNNDDGGVYEIRINHNGVKKGPPNFVATGNPQDDSDPHLIYKLGKPGTGRMSAIGSVMQNGFDKKNSTYYGQPLEFVGDDDWWSFLENIIGDITWEDDAIDAGYVDRLDNGDLVFVKQNLSKDSLNELAPDPGGGGGGGGDEGDDGFELPLDFKGQNIMVWPRNKKHSMGDTATPFPRGERFTGKVYIMWDQPKIEAIWYLDPKDREDREKEYKRVYEPRGWEDYLDHKWYDTTGVRYRLVTDWKLIPAKEPGGWPGIVDAWGQDMKGEVMNYPESFITEIIQKDGDGRHFVEPRQSVAEGQVNEFAPGDGSGEGRWYTDDQMIDIVGPDWAPEDDTGHLTLGQRLQDAQAWLDDQGYSVVVEDVQIDPEGGYRWKIYGEFYNPRFAKKDQGLAEDSLNEFAPTKSVGNFNRGGGGTGRGGDDDRNERDDSDDEGIINKILQALERLHPDPFETYGGEVEDVVVNLVSGGRLDDYIRAVGMGNIPMKELIKQGVIQTLKELKELYGDQGVAESQKSKHNISEFGEPPMIGWFKVGDIISGKLRDGRSYTGEIEEITVRPSGKIKQLEMAKVKILTLEGEEIDYRPIVSVWTRDPDLKKLSNRNQKGVAEGFNGAREYHGIIMSMIEGDDGFKLTATSPGGKKLGFVEFSYDTNGTIRAEELEVYEKFRGQGIAKTMYDYVKEQGLTIARSSEQTPAGAAFWDKNKPGKNIWEQGVAEGFTDDINLVYAMHPQPEESERVAVGISDMNENEFIKAWQRLPAEYQEEFNFDLPLWDTDELKNYNHITLKVMNFHKYVELIGNYIRSQEMSRSAMSALKKGVAEGQVNEFAPDDTNDGIWYNDNKIAKIVGRWWLADDLLSNASNIYMYGDDAKESATQEAEEQLRAKGFYVNVLDVRENTQKENLDWLISGPLVRVQIGEQGIAEEAEEDNKNLKGFHQSLGNAVRGRVSQMQANMAILKAQHPDTWLWEPGDIVYSAKTGRTYKIVGPWIDSHGTAKYLYQGNDEEKGTFVADKAHKTLKKLSENQEITEIANRRKEATLRIQKMLNDKFNANLDVDGILGPLTIASINKFMPNAKVKLADEPNRTTAVQGNKMKKENVNLESRYGDQYNVNKTTSVSLAKELNDMVLELGELIAASPKHPSLDRLKDKIVALNQELNDLGYDYDPQAENFLTPITLDMRNLHEGICPQCKGSIVAESMINEKKDSCYYKVKSRYKVWPSAYASGALVQCRKKGAKNWGKKNESKTVNDNKIYFSIPKSLANETELRESFNLRHDAKGWYLKEGQENFKKSYKDALKAFPLYKDTSEGLDMSKGTGSAPIKGDDFVLSPVGSIPKNKK